jgi:hypothetical protein
MATDTAIADAIKMYPQAKYLYQTSDNTIHTTREGADAQAVHLLAPSILRITCKTLKSTYLK